MSPRLVACWFKTNTNGEATVWPRLARVFQHTAAQHLAGWDLNIAQLEPLPIRSTRAIPADGHNTQKLDHWVAAAEGARDGDRLAFLDVDTALLRGLDDVWDLDFDVALTRRPRGFPYNGGVVFVRMSRRVRDFMVQWAIENQRMLADRPYHVKWQARYGGINQAALGVLMETGRTAGLKILDLPCSEWNCEDATWAEFGPATRILHVKSDLRIAIFRIPTMGLMPLATLWRALEREARATEARHEPAGMEAMP